MHKGAEDKDGGEDEWTPVFWTRPEHQQNTGPWPVIECEGLEGADKSRVLQLSSNTNSKSGQEEIQLSTNSESEWQENTILQQNKNMKLENQGNMTFSQH